jgi:hypothetical protein
MREAKPARLLRQGKADARGKAGEMRDAKQDRCARQGRADTGGKAIQMHEEWQVNVRGLSGQMREAWLVRSVT